MSVSEGESPLYDVTYGAIERVVTGNQEPAASFDLHRQLMLTIDYPLQNV